MLKIQLCHYRNKLHFKIENYNIEFHNILFKSNKQSLGEHW